MNLTQWKDELFSIVSGVDDPGQKMAAQAFAKALTPYLQELSADQLGSVSGGKIRTLLGKIKAEAL